MSKISLESRAEIDMPTPEPTEEGFGILIVMCAELAGFAGVLGHGMKPILELIQSSVYRLLRDLRRLGMSIQKTKSWAYSALLVYQLFLLRSACPYDDSPRNYIGIAGPLQYLQSL